LARQRRRSRRNDIAYKQRLFVLSVTALASPLWASQLQPPQRPGAPAAPPDARYCLRVDPVTGSKIETIRCETREAWAQLEVDVDVEWAANGVRIVTGTPGIL
jgi:hypothetical protein